jgi:hypothetical protein
LDGDRISASQSLRKLIKGTRQYVSNTNSKKKPTDPLTPVKTNICKDGNDDKMSFLGSPPLLPLDDPAEYKKLPQAASRFMPAVFY